MKLKSTHEVKYLVLLFFLFNLCKLNSQVDWELLNPKPTSNTGKDIHFVTPSIGFIINDNEILETLDSGVSWKKKQDISNGQDMNFYNSTGFIVGENGYVLKSVDNGNTWNQLDVGYSIDYNSVNLINELNIIISSTNHLIKSNDGGNTWQILSIPNVVVNKTFFVNNLIGHAACKNGTMLKTIDGGENWYVTQSSNTTPSDFFTVYFVSENIGFCTREHSNMYKTIDGGETWSEVQDIGDAIYSLYFSSENIGYATGDHGVIFKTIDGGDTWTWAGFQSGRISDTSMYGIYFQDDNIGYATGMRGRIIKTIDGGITWIEHSPTYFGIGELQFVNDNIAYANLGTFFLKTTDGGESWFKTTEINSQYYGISSFDFVTEDIGYGVIARAVIKTIDGGQNWTLTNQGEQLSSYDLTDIKFIDENVGFVGSGWPYSPTNSHPGLLKTEDGGETWLPINTDSFSKIRFIDANNGFALAYSRLYKTTDGGTTWSLIYHNGSRGISSFNFVDKDTGYFLGDSDDSIIYKTIDGGLNWQELSIPYGYYDLVKFYSNNVGYIVTEGGWIYKTINGGASWEHISSQPYRVYGIEFVSDNIFINAAYGRILRSKVEYDPVAFTLNADNFSIEVVSETCPDKNNGKITISAIETLDYLATINGIEYNFTEDLTIENLAPNNYELCISIPLKSYKQCYNIVVAEGTTVSGKSTVKSNNLTMQITGGTAPYSITKNGQLQFQTYSASFSLNVSHGDNIKVTTSKICEGSLSKTIELNDKIIAYPNPTAGDFEITIPIAKKEVLVEIFSIQSQLISTAKYKVIDGKVFLDIMNKPNGIYFSKVYLDEPITLKIIKQ